MKIKWGIKQQVLFLALIPTITISILLGFYFTKLRIESLTQELISRGIATATRLASQGEYGVFTNDIVALRTIARRELGGEIITISFYNKEGFEIASAGKLSNDIIPPKENLSQVHSFVDEKNDTISFLASVTLPEVVIDDYGEQLPLANDSYLKSTTIGWLKVEFERKPTKIKEYQTFIHFGLIVLLGIIICVLLALRISKKVTKPILKMANAVENIKQGKLNTRIHTESNWELEILQSGINTMASALEAAHEEMQINIVGATAELRNTLETIEIQNIELEISRKEAETASKIKSEFLASMSHELRTPLNGIVGFINLMKKTQLNDKQHEFLSIIEKSANSLLSIINDILDFSKLEAGKLSLTTEPMNIRECVEDALTLLAPGAHVKAIEIIPFIYSDVPEKIHGDSLRIKQIVTNLVSNAIKFTDKGSVIVRVMLENMIDNDVTLCISVNDTGIGMTKEQQKNLFHAFHQGSPNITRKFGGTGLGLVICKKLVEQMEGKIDFESTYQQGSTFWFTIKVRSIQQTTDDIDSLSKLSGKQILLYETHPVARLAMTHVLEKWQVKVTEVLKFNEIEKQLSNVDLVLIGMNQDTQYYERLKIIVEKVKSIKTIPIGVLVNTTDLSIHGNILQHGVSLCLAKPIIRKKLYDSIYQVLTEKSHEPHQHDLKSIKILAVDDHPANLTLVSALLDNLGISVSTVTSGEAAVEITNQELFSLIFMDINMPGMDGIEASSKIRQSSRLNQNTPIVALSAHILDNERENLIYTYMNDFLTKPINENQLQAAIYKWAHQGVITIDNKKTKDICSKVAPIDWELCVSLAANKREIAKDLLQMLIDNLANDAELVNKSYKDNDLKALGDHAHKLHGACCYTGVPRLKSIVKKMEEILVKGSSHYELSGLIESFNSEVNAVLDYYKSHMAEKLAESV